MADTKISELTAVTTPALADIIPVVQSGSNKRLTALQLAALLKDRANVVSFSATPIFDLSLGDIQVITLTGNVTSSSLSNITQYRKVTFIIIQDPTGSRTFAWPGTVLGAPTVDPTASSVSVFEGISINGTQVRATSLGVST